MPALKPFGTTRLTLGISGWVWVTGALLAAACLLAEHLQGVLL